MTPSLRRVVPALFAAALTVLVVSRAVGERLSIHVAVACMLYLGFALYAAWATADDMDGWVGVVVPSVQLALTIFLMWVIILERTGGVPEGGRGLYFTAIFAALVALPLLAGDAREYVRTNAPYLLAFAVVLGVYLSHAAALPSGSGSAAFPVYAGLLFSLNLAFVPRYVTRDAFLWIVSVLSGVVVVAGLLVYVLGEYTVGPVPVRRWSEPVALFGVDLGISVVRSIFPNPQELGTVAFAGSVAAMILFVEAARARTHRPTLLDPVPPVGPYSDRAALASLVASGVLLALGGVGMVVSMNRTSLLSASATGAVYLGTVALGRRRLPQVFGVVTAAVVLFLVGIFVGAVPVDPSHRFEVWGAALQAVVRSPQPLFGRGIVAGSEVIEPLLTEPAAGYSTHNSYLSTFIRVGLVGGAAYLVLTAANVIDGAVSAALDGRAVDVGLLAFAAGFTLHQLFEAYSLYHFQTGSVLATLAYGYLLASRVSSEGRERPDSRDSRSRSGPTFGWT